MNPTTILPLSIPEQGVKYGAEFSVFVVLGYILLFLGILALAYYSTRMVGKAYDRSRATSSIKVIDRRLLAQDKSITVVKISDAYYVLYTDRHHTLLLDKLNDYPEEVPKAPDMNFQKVLNQFLSKKNDSHA